MTPGMLGLMIFTTMNWGGDRGANRTTPKVRLQPRVCVCCSDLRSFAVAAVIVWMTQ